MEIGKAIAVAGLSRLGFAVEEIPTGRTKTADLRVSDNESTYLIEAKDKFESPNKIQEREDNFADGDVFETMTPHDYDNRLSAILRDAREQLNETPDANGAFRIIWFHAVGYDADMKYRRAAATFYGFVPLSPLYPNSHLPLPRCFYFDRNEASRMPDIEAVILSSARGDFQVSVNDLAVRADAFRASKLYRVFADLKGVYDPKILEANGDAIACRFDTSGMDEPAKLEALEKQTGILYSCVRFKRYEGSAFVPWGENSPQGGR